MKPSGIVTLTTDFGSRDWFAGTMKGVILAINRAATIVDLTHEVPPGDIRSGAFSLLAACRYFPRGTVHVAVVDPGVGSRRRAVAVETPNYYFVGPDNGLLALALSREKITRIRSLDNGDYFLQPVSHTFHGRDLFAPVAAHLSRGLKIEKLGRAVDQLETIPWPAPRKTATGVFGEIVYIDCFGNAFTNLSSSIFEPQPAATSVMVKGKLRCPLRSHYQSVPAGRPVAVPGSSGFLEIAINAGSAAARLKLKVGDAVIVRFSRRQ